MRPALYSLLLIFSLSTAHAIGYGHYDIKLALRESVAADGHRYGVDGRYIDQMLSDLGTHAKNYPPQFDSDQDRQRAILDARALAGVFDVLLKAPNPKPDILLRAGFLHSLLHNLDIPGSADKTSSIFKQLFSTAPNHPKGNYIYGAFLAGSARPKEALPYLDQANTAGLVEATYALGMTYLALGNPKKALEYLESYRTRVPTDENIGKLIDAVRTGTIRSKPESGRRP